MSKRFGYCEICEALTDTYPHCWECVQGIQDNVELSEEFILALANAVKNGKIGEEI
jgi:hypothetical protein